MIEYGWRCPVCTRLQATISANVPRCVKIGCQGTPEPFSLRTDKKGTP